MKRFKSSQREVLFCLVILLAVAGVLIAGWIAAPQVASARLRESLATSDLAGIRNSIRIGANPHVHSTSGVSALHVASGLDDLELVRELLSRGLSADDADKAGRTPLFYTDSIVIARVLCTRGADVNRQDRGGVTPLMIAAHRGDKALVAFLLKVGAIPELRDRDGRSAAMCTRNSEIIQLLHSHSAAGESSGSHDTHPYEQ